MLPTAPVAHDVEAATCPSSLQTLIDATPTGGTLTVPACTYHESISIRKRMTVMAAGAVVDGDNVRAHGVEVFADGVTIDGLTVKRVKNDWHIGAVNSNGNDDFTFRNGVIRDSTTVCIALHGGARGQILDSELTGCGQQGYFLNAMVDTVFARNHIHHNNMALAFDWEVEAGGGKTMASRRITFQDNEVAWNRGPGLWFDNLARDVVVTGNRIHHNDTAGIHFEISSGAVITRNAIWNNGFAKAHWGWGAGIVVSSSDGAQISQNTIAWNARGVSVVSQGRNLAPNDHNTVIDNVIVSATGDRASGWYDDNNGSLFSSANANTGRSNRYWIGVSEPSFCRFEWAGCRSTLAAFNATAGEDGATYLTTGDRDALLVAAGIPTDPGVRPPAPAPRTGDPRITLRTTRVGTSGVPATISWSAIAIAQAYQVQIQRDGGSWSSLKLASATSRSVSVTLTTGHQYRTRLRIKTTPPETWSAWSYSSPVTAVRYGETNSHISYGGTWRRVTSHLAAGGYVTYATRSGASAKLTFSGSAVEWFAPLGPSRGSAKVYIDGVYRTTVSLYRSTIATRRIVYKTSWSTSGTHTLEIRVVGTSGHPRVDIDGFAFLR